MSPELFQQLFERRSTYPLGISRNHENANDEKYIRDELRVQANNDFVFLLLPDYHLDKASSKSLREELLSSYNMVGIFNVGAILDHITNIKFNLYVLGKFAPRKIWFGELSKNKAPFKRYRISKEERTEADRTHGTGDDWAHFKNELLPVKRDYEPYLYKYLESIDLAINDGKKDDYIAADYRIFGADASKFGSRYNIDYYKPELIEMEAKLAHEQTVKLGDIAEIIYPREPAVLDDLFTIRLSDAKYPLKSDALVPIRNHAPTASIRRNDIVTNTFLNSAYLNLTQRPDLVAANTQVIIRLHDDRFTHAYVTTYLNSDRMHAYFMRRKTGSTIPRLNRQDFADFEIVIPTRRTNELAKEFLSSLSEFDSEKRRVEAINKTLFAPASGSNKPLQNELLAELHQQLQLTRNTLIKDLFDVDLHEIEKCYKAGAYKACLVLCGSLLEALVLDWLSEIERKDYFDTNDITSLEALINKLRDAEALTTHELQMAHEIRKKRNLIHPKNYIENTPLHKEICEEVMEKLKPLVAKRYNYSKETNQ